MKKSPRIALSLIMLGSIGTSWALSASGSLDIPDTDTTNNITPAVKTSTHPANPPADVTSNGQQPKTTPSKGGRIQNLMDQLSGELKNLLLTGGPSTARWEIDSKSLIRLIRVFDPQFSAPEAPATFGFAYPAGYDKDIWDNHCMLNGWLFWDAPAQPSSRTFPWSNNNLPVVGVVMPGDYFPYPLPETL